MKKYIEILQKSVLFSGVLQQEIVSMTSCLGAVEKSYKKGEYIISAGEKPSGVAVLVKGRLHIQNDDYWGNRSIVSSVLPGDMFAEAYAGTQTAVLNDIVALEDSVVVYFDYRKILSTCSSSCVFHRRIIENLFYAISCKNRSLVRKLSHMSKRSTREKLISYLSEFAKAGGSSEFTLPFNRQEMADFLSVDRSAMSKELCRMRDEGLLEFDKNRFILKTKKD